MTVSQSAFACITNIGGNDMKCQKCGEENLDNLTICKKCKEDLNKIDQTILDANNNNQSNPNDTAKTSAEKLELNTANSVNVYCQCSQKLEPDCKICPSCKRPVNVVIKPVVDELKKTKNENVKALIIITIAALLLLIGNIKTPIIGMALFSITIVSGKIAYPENKFLNAAFGIMIIFLIILIVAYILSFIILRDTINSCIG